jgi:hypothetical protein
VFTTEFTEITEAKTGGGVQFTEVRNPDLGLAPANLELAPPGFMMSPLRG